MNAKETLIEAFKKSGANYGDFVSHKDLDRMAGLSYPRFEGMNSQADLERAMKEYALLRLSAVEGLKAFALTELRMYLQPVHGQGYRIVHPREQTDVAIQTGMRTIKKGLQQAERGIEHINKALLSNDERAYASSVASRLAGLKLMMGRRRDLLESK